MTEARVVGCMELDAYLDEFNARDWEPNTEPEGGPLRMAIIGLGGFARNRALPAIEQTTHCETTVVVSSSPDKAETVATRFEADHTLDYEEFHAGRASDAYDAVYIATPPAFHLEHAETAAGHGKHVLCEKPMEVTVERAERMVRVCEDADVTLMIAYRLQTEPAVRRLRELIHDGFIGEPVYLHGQFSSKILDGDSENDVWRVDPDIAGGGALMDLGIYPLNTSRFLLGMDPVAVQATTATPHEEFAGVDEHVSFQVSFPDDVTGSFSASFNAHRESRLQVVGAKGQVLIESAFGSLVNRDNVVERGDMHTEFTGPYVNEVVEEFEYFATKVLTNADPEPDGSHGLTDLKVMTEAYDSAETGSWVTLR
jgi:predicted dehydrogenase